MTSTPPNESFYTPLHWSDFCNALEILNGFNEEKHIPLGSSLEYSLELIRNGCESISANKDVKFRLTAKELDVSFESALRDYLLQKPRYMKLLFGATANLLVIFSDSSDVNASSNVILCIESLHLLYSAPDLLDDLRVKILLPQIISDTKSSLDYVRTLNSTPETVKLSILSILSIIIDFEETCAQQLRQLTLRDPLIAQYLQALHATEKQQGVIQNLLSLMPETTTESEVFKILFQKISVAEDELDYEAVTTLLQLCAIMSESMDSVITSVTRLTEYWKSREMQHRSFCSLLRLVLVNETNFSQIHTTEYLISTVVPRLIIILSELDTSQSSTIGLHFCSSLSLLSLVLQNEVNLDLFVNAAVPKIVKYGLMIPTENSWRDKVVKQELLFFETSLLYGGKMTSQLITGDFEAIFGFWDVMKKRAGVTEPTILIKSLEFGMSVVKQGASKFSHDKIGVTDVLPLSQMKMPKKLMKFLLPGSLAHIFSETLSSIANRFFDWDDSGAVVENLVVTLLEFGTTAIQHSMDKDILFSNYVTSTIISKLHQLEIRGEDKCNILVGWLRVLSGLLSKGCNINSLLSSGIPLLVKQSSFAEHHASQKYVEALEQLSKRFEWNGRFDLVEDISVVFTHIANEYDEKNAQMVVMALIQHGKRHHVKTLRDFCALPSSEQSSQILNYVFSHSSSDLMFQLNEVCKTLNSADQITRNSKNPLLNTAVQNIINKLLDDMSHNFSRAVAKKCNQELCKILLLKAFLSEELDNIGCSNQEDHGGMLEQFSSKFPSEVMNHSGAKDTLEQLAVRMNKIATRHKEVHSLVSDLLKQHLFVSTGSCNDIINNLNTAVFQLPQNVRLREHLRGNGYSTQLFNQDLYAVIQTSMVASVDNVKSALIGCYGEYVDFLKEFGVKKLKFGEQSHEFIGLDNVFDTELPVEVLKSRKEAIDAKIKEMIANPPSETTLIQFPNEERRAQIEQRLHQLAQTEIKIEYQMEKQKSTSRSTEDDTVTFVVVFRNLFWSSLGTSGQQIVGCYAPDGEHAEKPIEISLKSNSAILSLYVLPNSDADNIEQAVAQLKSSQEIENMEALMTDHGLLVFKSYSNGHCYDTSVAWCYLFKELLVQQYVPAILIPNGFPNLRSFKTLHSCVPSEYQGSIISFRDDFFGDRKTYFDYPVDKIKEDDLIVTQQNVNMISLPRHKNVLSMRPLSSIQDDMQPQQDKPLVNAAKTKLVEKDLPSTITAEVLKELSQHKSLKQQANVYGKFIQMYISKLMNQGISDESVLMNGFDMDRWNKKILNKRNKTKDFDKMLMTDETRMQMVNSIIGFINQRLEDLLNSDLAVMIQSSRSHFFELKLFCETALRSSQNHPLQRKITKCSINARQIAASSCVSCVIHELEPSTQNNIIKYVYMNEQQVWQNRGTRMENLDQFIQLLHTNKNGTKFPGVAILHMNEEDTVVSVKNVVGYSIGEFCDEDTYEVITAWSHPAYKGSYNAIKLYIETMREAHSFGAKYLLCDMLKGSVEHVIRASSLFCFLHRVGLTKFIILEQKPSYSVEVSPGKTEQFERINLHINRFLWGLRVLRWVGLDAERITSFKRLTNGQKKNTENTTIRKSNSRVMFLGSMGATAAALLAFRLWK